MAEGWVVWGLLPPLLARMTVHVAPELNFPCFLELARLWGEDGEFSLPARLA